MDNQQHQLSTSAAPRDEGSATTPADPTPNTHLATSTSTSISTSTTAAQVPPTHSGDDDEPNFEDDQGDLPQLPSHALAQAPAAIQPQDPISTLETSSTGATAAMLGMSISGPETAAPPRASLPNPLDDPKMAEIARRLGYKGPLSDSVVRNYVRGAPADATGPWPHRDAMRRVAAAALARRPAPPPPAPRVASSPSPPPSTTPAGSLPPETQEEEDDEKDKNKDMELTQASTDSTKKRHRVSDPGSPAAPRVVNQGVQTSPSVPPPLQRRRTQPLLDPSLVSGTTITGSASGAAVGSSTALGLGRGVSSAVTSAFETAEIGMVADLTEDKLPEGDMTGEGEGEAGEPAVGHGAEQ